MHGIYHIHVIYLWHSLYTPYKAHIPNKMFMYPILAIYPKHSLFISLEKKDQYHKVITLKEHKVFN